MIKPEELQVGLLVWWTRNNDGWGGSWNCPCVVSYVNREENKFKVISFDDMKETSNKSGGLSIIRPEGGDKSSLEEMRISSIQEVEKYFTERTGELGKKASELMLKHNELVEKIVTYQDSFQRIKSGNFMSYYYDKNDKQTIIS